MNKDIRERKQKLFENYERTQNTKDMFRLTNNILGWKNGRSPTSLMKDGKLCQKPEDIVNIHNDYFNNKVETVMAGLPADWKDPLEILTRTMDKWKTNNTSRQMELKEIEEIETLKIINTLSSSTAHGDDRLDSLTIKMAVT